MNSRLRKKVSEVINFSKYMNKRKFFQTQVQILKFVEKIVVFPRTIKNIIQLRDHRFRITFKNNIWEKIKISTCHKEESIYDNYEFYKVRISNSDTFWKDKQNLSFTISDYSLDTSRPRITHGWTINI